MTKSLRSALICFTGIVLWICGIVLMISTDDVGPRVIAIALISFGIPLTLIGGRGLRSSADE